MDDDAFLQTIAANPADPTPRLIYADWLEERGDPRADYLRLEQRWLGLATTDAEYRPLFLRMNRLARSIHVDWLLRASQLSHEIAIAWQRVECKFQTKRAAPGAPSPREVWDDHLATLHRYFCRVAGADAVAESFCVPLDYALFMVRIGGGWTDPDDWMDLWGAAAVAGCTQSGCEIYEEEFCPGHRFWLDIGCVGDKHSHFLSCDLRSSWFGVVEEFEDAHPWMSHDDDATGIEHGVGWSFLESLRQFVYLSDDVTVVVDDPDYLYCNYAHGTTQDFAWTDLQEVYVIHRPTLWRVERDFLHLIGKHSSCLVPRYARGYAELEERIAQLPGANQHAMHAIGYGVRRCWQRQPAT